MKPTSDLKRVAERMLMVEKILRAFANGAMPMHPAGYQELADWARESFGSMDSGALRSLRDAAPLELRAVIENVLHDRGVISWAADAAVGLSAWAECLSLLRRCRNHVRRRRLRIALPSGSARDNNGLEEAMGVYAVSKVRLDEDGRVIAVYWGRVDTETNTWATAEAVAPVRSVVEAIQAGDQVFALFPSTHGHVPDRQFMVVDYESGWETIALDGPPTFEREVHDMERLDAQDMSRLHGRSGTGWS